MEREQQYVGIDLHRRRSVIVRMNDAGEVVGVSKIDNDPVALAMAVAEAGPDPEVALEACYGWYWAADLLQAEGARVHLVHPLGLHWDTRRVKNDVKDATELANRLRRNDLPEAWIAPPEVRELRELVRYRAKLTALRTSAKAQVHAVMAKLGSCRLGRMFGPSGQKLMDEMDFPGPYGLRVESLRDLLEIYDRELAMVEREMPAGSRTTLATKPSRPCMGSGRSSLPSWWPRSATSIASRRPGICARGPGLPPSCTSPTRPSTAAVLPSRVEAPALGGGESVARYHGGQPIAPTYSRIADRRGKHDRPSGGGQKASDAGVRAPRGACSIGRGGRTRLWAVAAAY